MLRLHMLSRTGLCLEGRQQRWWRRPSLFSTSSSPTTSPSRRVPVVTRINDVIVTVLPGNAPHLIPNNLALSPSVTSSLEVEQHLEWIAKKWSLGADMMLLGHNSELKRQLALLFAQVVDLEVEYIRLTRDTTEADLKQRRELSGSSVTFHNQAAVRAALHGRMLILDGIDQVERNVLPALNNLLENREMGLDDGARLGSSSLPVHPQFRVIALGLPTPPYGPGSPLDPPLRSRFTSRFIDELRVDTMAEIVLSTHNSGKNTTARVNALLSWYETLRHLRATALQEGASLSALPVFGLRHFEYCLQGGDDTPAATFLARVKACVPAFAFQSTTGLGGGGRFGDALRDAWESIVNAVGPAPHTPTPTPSSSLAGPHAGLTSAQSSLLVRLHDDLLVCSRHVAILGPRSSGKSHLVRAFAVANEKNIGTLTFPLHNELTARDLLQRRVTTSDGATRWDDSTIVRAAREGKVCVLDGLGRVDAHALTALQRLLLDGVVDLPNGERLVAQKNFRCVALGEMPAKGQRFAAGDLNLSFYELPAMSAEDMLAVSRGSSATTQVDALDAAVLALHADNAGEGEAGMEAVRPTIRHVKRLRSIFATDDKPTAERVRAELETQLLVRYQGESVRRSFDKVFSELNATSVSTPTTAPEVARPIFTEATLTIGDTSSPRRTPTDASYVPRPLFFDNSNHTLMLQALLRAYSAGEKAFLLIGNQGVGKNKIIDHFLSLLNAEREYIQLHRDSTVNSLTVIPSLRDGRIVYEDSVVLRAARRGSFLVVDEADKAPSEISFVLKHIAEDGELQLTDGRRLLSHERFISEGGDPSKPDDKTILIHPDFRLVVLANRPGFPFLGNDFYRAIGGIFHNLIVENLDYKSELELLGRYGEKVDTSIIQRLSRAFALLREDHNAGKLTYPYSVRENVAIVKHLTKYPTDGVIAAVESILAFEHLSPSVRAHVALVFQQAGIPIPLTTSPSDSQAPSAKLSPPIALPASETLTLTLGPASTTSLASVKPMKRSPWPSFQAISANPGFTSSRIDGFAEKIGVLSGMSGNVGASGGKVIGGAASASASGGALHFLSVDPLVVHSFLGGGKTYLSGEPASAEASKYHAIELLSNEMGYRLGSFTPAILPGPSSGAVVLVPELSMAMVVTYESEAGTSTPGVDLLTLPLSKAIAQPGQRQPGSSSSSSGAFASLFGGGGVNSTAAQNGDIACATMQSSRVDSPVGSAGLAAPAIVYRRGGSELAILDFSRDVVGSVVLPLGSQADDVVLFESSDEVLKLLLSSKGEVFHASLPRKFESGSVISVQSVSFGSAKSPSSLINSMTHQSTLGGASAVYGGTTSTHSSHFTTSSVTHWPRTDDKDTQRPTSVPFHAISPLGTVHNVTTGRNSDDGNASSSLTLEVVDIQAQSKRRVPLGLASSSKKTKKSIEHSTSKIVSALSWDEPIVAIARKDGAVELYETDRASLDSSLATWKKMWRQREEEGDGGKGGSKRGKGGIERLGGGGREGGASVPRTGLDAPKHGKEDDKDHVGGNQWAGGTGGSDTAGLGGRGGPYRIDKGFPVRQVSDEEKAKVSKEAKEAAAKMAKEALEKRLKEIKLGKGQYEQYLTIKTSVAKEIQELSAVLEEFSRRTQERVWLRSQAEGELDDSKLVDGLTGERLVFKKRVDPSRQQNLDVHKQSQGASKPKHKRFHFCIDVSASMFRFNSSDGRLQRLLEAVLLLLESLGSLPKDTPLDYAITGHSGDSPEISLLAFDDPKPKDEAQRYQVLEQIVSYSQFSQAGDYTLHALELAGKRAISAPSPQGTAFDDSEVERRVFCISDANFERYGITPVRVRSALNANAGHCRSDLVLIGNRDGEGDEVARACPGQVHLCLDSKDLPKTFKKLLIEGFDV